MKKIFIILGVITSFVILDKAYHHTSYKFSPSKILYTHKTPPVPTIDTDHKLSEIEYILEQPLHFFAKGSQAYAFISADGNYILKILKQHKFHPRTHLSYVPFLPQHAELIRRQKKAEKAFTSFQNAFSGFCSETGLLAIHLVPSNSWKKIVTLIDKKGNEHSIDLGKTSFALQKKAEFLYPTLTQLIETGKTGHAKQRINSLMLLLHKLAYEGVVDNDPILRRNFGFIGENAIEFDIGMFGIDPSRKGHILSKEELKKLTAELYSWLDHNHPELADYLKTQWL